MGQLFVQNAGDKPIRIASVSVVPGGGGLVPTGPVWVSGPERIEALGEAGFITMPGDPAAAMPLSDPRGYVVPPVPGQTIEIVYTVVTPDVPHSWISGIEITYNVGWRRYKEKFTSVISVCTPAFEGECPDHA